jgi:dephospho-CoA kinase
VIIGLTGSCCSGKDTIADYMAKKYNYRHFSLSNVIRNIMEATGIKPTRENLIAFGTNLREKNGNGILAKKILEKIGYNGKYCITSIRHSQEVIEFRKRRDFVLINVYAPEDIRFRRMQRRKRLGDPQTLEKFIELEQKESQTSGPGQQIKKTANMADITFTNDCDNMAALEINVDKMLKSLVNKINI